MEKLKLYIVTKSSSNKNILAGDLIWLSDNGDLNNAMGGGWLAYDEWNVEGTNDFEYEISNTHYLDVIVGHHGRQEIVRMKDSFVG